ncbi:MAG: diaminopimelate decarboxylase family protein [Candidatus Thorarchaeota archaeon]
MTKSNFLNMVNFFPYLEYRENTLEIETKTVNEITKEYPTPLFLFIPDRFKQNFKELKINLNKSIPNLFITYAMKANYLGGVLRQTKELGLGIEVMSIFEILLAKKAGFSYDNFVFNGPAKSATELEHTIQRGIKYLNVDSLNELRLIEEIAKKENIQQSITVRIHPQLSESTERKLLIKKNSKLGIDYSRGVKLLEYAEKSTNLKPTGIHIHVGTNIISHNFYEELLIFVNDYINDLENKKLIQIQEINLGGGLASKSKLDESGFSIEKLGKQISSNIDNINEKRIIFEPGRYLVEDSFIAITKVLRTKKSWGRKWAFVDIGANSLIPMRYSEYRILPSHYKGKGQYCNIGGPLCLPVDVVTNEAVDFEIDENDLLIVLNCGAYTLSMSEQFGYPRPAVCELENDGSIKLLKPADDIDQMVNEAFWSEKT